MSTLYEILHDAQGGQALDNLAAQFNITTEEADAAVKALLPALSEQLLKQTSEPTALGAFAGALGAGRYLAAFNEPSAAEADAQTDEPLSQVLGSSEAREEIVLRAASATGVSQHLLSQMLPVIASIILGGLTKNLQNQGFGGILGQLARAASQGGLGSILGQVLGGAPEPAPQPEPTPAPAPGRGASPRGLGSLLRVIVGSILGGFARRQASADAQRAPHSPAPAPQAPGFDTALIQASLEALTKMLQPGTPAPAAEPSAAAPAPEGQEQPPPASPEDPLSNIKAELDRIISARRE